MYFLFTYFISLFFYGASRNRTLLFSILIVILWSIVIASRDESYGQDIVMYYHIFLDPDYYKLDELGLNYLNSIISFFSNDFFLFSIVYALLINFLSLYIFKIFDNKNYLLLYIYFTSYFIFYQLNFNIYRQGLAVILSIMAIFLYSRNKFYFLLLPLSVFFHKAAILAVIFFAFSLFKFKRWYLLIALFMAIVPIPSVVYISLAEIAGKYVPLLSNSLIEYVRVAEAGIIGAASLDQKNIPIIISLIFMFFLRLNYSKLQGKIFIVYTWGVIFASLFKNNVIIYDRVILYSQVLFPYILYIILKQLFPRGGNMLYILLSIIQICITVLIWGPRNFLSTYSFYMF